MIAYNGCHCAVDEAGVGIAFDVEGNKWLFGIVDNSFEAILGSFLEEAIYLRGGNLFF